MKKYYILTLGCQMNVSDSERIATKIESLGYKSAPEKDADLVIVNACSVRQRAVDRIWGGIKKWQKSDKKVIITGCVLPADRQKLNTRDVLSFNINNLLNLKTYLSKPSNILQNIGVFSARIINYYITHYLTIEDNQDIMMNM